MINRNIGRTERIVRLILAMALIVWVLRGASFGLAEAAATAAAFALLWNSIFGRCYLWKWLGLSSCSSESDECNPKPPGGSRA